MVQTFASQALAVEADIDVILETPDDALAQKKSKDLLDRLNATPLDRSHQSFDSRRLPNDLLKADPQRKPKLTVDAFQAALLTENEAAARYAQATPFDLSQLPGASTPTYLEPTAEVSIDSAIRAKAEELNRDPVAIYNWVRNSIYFQPTWGAIQDASLTLSSRQGNAFDIASLTIALLRASGVPSRYVYGTIELPEAKFRNWTGGFESVLGAIDFSSAGGVPLVAVTAGRRNFQNRIEQLGGGGGVALLPDKPMPLVKGIVLTEEYPPMTVKGFVRPINVYKVLGTYQELVDDGRVVLQERDGLRVLVDLTKQVSSEAIKVLEEVLAELKRRS